MHGLVSLMWATDLECFFDLIAFVLMFEQQNFSWYILKTVILESDLKVYQYQIYSICTY